MKNLIFYIVLIYSLSINSITVSAELVINKLNQLSSEVAVTITEFAKNNFENMKYLDFDIQIKEKLKPTFSIMSVSELLKIDSGTIFNQTSLNTHDDDETINIGFGVRKLLNDNKIIVGSNIFYDYQFDEKHKRTGAGVEAISSVFDLRANLYNAISGSKTTAEGSERALDGWDTQLDYHLPGERDVNIFANIFKFENPDKTSTYEEKGNKFGANATSGNFIFEGGYLNDNQNNDSLFGSVKFVVKLGDQGEKRKQNFLEYTDVSNKLYQPIKRENKIRVVKISKTGVKVGGF